MTEICSVDTTSLPGVFYAITAFLMHRILCRHNKEDSSLSRTHSSIYWVSNIFVNFCFLLQATMTVCMIICCYHNCYLANTSTYYSFQTSLDLSIIIVVSIITAVPRMSALTVTERIPQRSQGKTETQMSTFDSKYLLCLNLWIYVVSTGPHHPPSTCSNRPLPPLQPAIVQRPSRPLPGNMVDSLVHRPFTPWERGYMVDSYLDSLIIVITTVIYMSAAASAHQIQSSVFAQVVRTIRT